MSEYSKKVRSALDAAVSAIGGQPRDGQIEMAEAVANALSDRHHLLVQAVKIEKAPVDTSSVGSSMELFEKMAGVKSDAPLCMTCGVKMRMAGSCFVCEGCGNTSGCS